MAKYPQAHDVYECQLYPGRSCRVVQVVNAQVTFEWLGDYARLEPQVVPVNRFVVDFKPLHATSGSSLRSSPPSRGR
jgi:hypothetical protein